MSNFLWDLLFGPITDPKEGLGNNSLEEDHTAEDCLQQKLEKRAQDIDDSWCG